MPFRQFRSAVQICLLLCLIVACGDVGAATKEASSPRDPAWAEPVQLHGSDNFFLVAPGLYRSAQPDATGMRQYEAMGIRTVINLRANHSDDNEAVGTGLVLRHIPINTWSIKDSQVVDLLVMLRTEQHPLLVHCQHGADRTGLMMAMYRMVEQGWSRERAIAELREGGYGFHSIWTNIPRYLEKVDVDAIRRQVDARTGIQTGRNGGGLELR